MKTDVQELQISNISSEIFHIAPTQIDYISKHFGDALAEAMNMRPLAQRICQIAKETLIQSLQSAKNMGAN